MSNEIFRKSALDKLASPEKVNEYIHVSSVSTFVILAGLILFMCAVIIWGIWGHVSENVRMQGVIFPFEGTTTISLPNDGMVHEVFVKRGDYVHQGDRLALVGVNTQSSILRSQESGIVMQLKSQSSTFKAYEPIFGLLRQDSIKRSREIIAFATFNDIRNLQLGMPVQVSPVDLPREKYGYMHGRIVSIAKYPITKKEVLDLVKVESMTQDIFPQQVAFVIRILLSQNPDMPGKIWWSHSQKEHIDIANGTFCNIQIQTKYRPVYQKLFEVVDETVNKMNLWLE